MNNTNAQQGGGLASHNGTNTVVVQNSIIWGNNTSGSSREIRVATGSVSVSNSDVKDRFGNGVSGTVTWGSPDTNIGENTSTHDPDFTSSSDFRLTCGSPCINTGSDAVVPADQFDVDGDGYSSTTTPAEPSTPDLDLHDRIIGKVDMGSYETIPQPVCTGDVAPPPCGNGVVNIDDLVAIITHWGNCPVWSSPCTYDIAALGSRVIDIDDLVAVITHWTTPGNPCGSSGSYNAGSFTSVDDCMDAASLDYTPYSDEWNEYVQKCTQALCEAQIINCD